MPTTYSQFYKKGKWNIIEARFYNELTDWSRFLLEKLIVTQLVKKFSTFHGTERFIMDGPLKVRCILHIPSLILIILSIPIHYLL
jgi:hypothetical protein